MDVLQQIFNSPPPPPPEEVCYPKPEKPFPNMVALGLTFVVAAVFNTFLRYFYVVSDNPGAKVAAVALGFMIFAAAVGLYIAFALSRRRKSPDAPGLGLLDFFLTIFFQIVLFLTTFAGARALLRL